ncbi:unnamed protein product, partial [Polarella glacialis]
MGVMRGTPEAIPLFMPAVSPILQVSSLPSGSRVTHTKVSTRPVAMLNRSTGREKSVQDRDVGEWHSSSTGDPYSEIKIQRSPQGIQDGLADSLATSAASPTNHGSKGETSRRLMACPGNSSSFARHFSITRSASSPTGLPGHSSSSAGFAERPRQVWWSSRAARGRAARSGLGARDQGGCRRPPLPRNRGCSSRPCFPFGVCVWQLGASCRLGGKRWGNRPRLWHELLTGFMPVAEPDQALAEEREKDRDRDRDRDRDKDKGRDKGKDRRREASRSASKDKRKKDKDRKKDRDRSRSRPAKNASKSRSSESRPKKKEKESKLAEPPDWVPKSPSP